jgi:uncharacterized protein involved in exopolysaccharide biosynthesis
MSTEASPAPERPEQQGLTVSDYLEIALRRKRELIWFTLMLFSIIAIVTVVLPNKYQSIATVLIEQSEIPDDFVQTTVRAGTRQQLGETTERVLTTENLRAIIEKHGLYPELVEETSIDEVAREARRSVKVELVSSAPGRKRSAGRSDRLRRGLRKPLARGGAHRRRRVDGVVPARKHHSTPAGCSGDHTVCHTGG